METTKDAGELQNSVEINGIRRIFPQVLITILVNLLLLDVSFSYAFPTVIIPALTGLNEKNNPNETIQITGEQSSWIGGLVPISEAVASLTSGWITDSYGRKKMMLMMNIFHAVAWLLLYSAENLTEIFVAHILHGFGIGFITAAVKTYIGEICDASIRGSLSIIMGIVTSIAQLVIFAMGNLTDWRHSALYCSPFSIICFICILFIPESPLWLLGKDRHSEALLSLKILRGFAPSECVEKELSLMEQYSKSSKRCSDCISADLKICSHPQSSFKQNLQELLHSSTIRPFAIILLTYLVNYATLGLIGPYLVQIMKSYGSPVEPNLSIVIMSLVTLFGMIVVMSIIAFIGKRRLFLYCLAVTVSCKLALVIYGFTMLPFGLVSFNLLSVNASALQSSYFPFTVFLLMSFFAVGNDIISHVICMEVYPLKARSTASGVTNTVTSIMYFTLTKLHYYIEIWFSLSGAMCLYFIISLACLILAYFIFPETEKHTLEEIEMHFSSKNFKWKNHKISKAQDYVE